MIENTIYLASADHLVDVLRQTPDPMAYTPGLVWQVPGEQVAQAGLKRELLVWLNLADTAPASARATLTRLIEALPVTGRVRVPLAEARWLRSPTVAQRR